MFARSFQRYRLPAVALGVLSAAVLTFTAMAGGSDPQLRLQQIADQAALAGAVTLGTTEASSEQDRRADALEATKQILDTIPAVKGEIVASLQDLTVTVKLAAAEAQTSSTARYTPPDQSADWSWASRQRFAFKRAPVMVGSTCVQGCDVVR